MILCTRILLAVVIGASWVAGAANITAGRPFDSTPGKLFPHDNSIYFALYNTVYGSCETATAANQPGPWR